ncbi:MAG: DNA methyltransferase [Caldilineaceae bacterium]
MPALSITLLRQVSGVGQAAIQNFVQQGYRTLDDLANASVDELTAVPGVGAATAQAIRTFLDSVGDAQDAVQSYRFDETRKNIPPAGLAAQGQVLKEAPTRYAYDPHLPPVLRFDATGAADQLPALLATAKQRALTDAEAHLLADALRHHQPWLEWSGKRATRGFDVDPVALHIHERLAAEAIVELARRKPLQRTLFAEPELDFWEQVKFYQHDMDWTNRLILGDSLTVMTSLARREDLAGKVQMIYIDPPYGIKFASNFQPFVNNREVKDREQDLTREPEQVKAYRDTWTLGIHSYLAYLRDRLIAARELLKPEGSIFVQINDENLHRVISLMEEVFGVSNCCGVISYQKTTYASSTLLPQLFDYIVWFARDISQVKYHQLFDQLDNNEIRNKYRYVSEGGIGIGQQRMMSKDEYEGILAVPPESVPFMSDNLTSPGFSSGTTVEFDFAGKTYYPGSNLHWKTSPDGLTKLAKVGRLFAARNSLRYVRCHEDFPVSPIKNLWTDTTTGSFAEEKLYVVQTSTKAIQRCLLMTTDPGDLVLDPTCGSGTTAYVAEQWGRRWITIDTSRVALALARQRLLTAKFDYYQKEQPNQPLHPARNKFLYATVPHITLKSIAQNQALDPIFARWEPILADKLAQLNAALAHVTPEVRTLLQTKLINKEKTEGKRALTDADRRRWLLPKQSWQEWEVPFDVDADWPLALQDALTAYRTAWRQKMDAVNAAIAASAPQETLVDRPQVVKGVVRVSGPFTVEGVQPAEERMDRTASPIGGGPESMTTFGSNGSQHGVADDPANAEAYLARMISLLRQDGVRFLNNQQITIDRLAAASGSQYIHAEGDWSPERAATGVQKGAAAHVPLRRLAVSFGPQYGPLTAKQVEEALWETSRRGYDDIIFAGFTIDGAAQAAIAADPNPRVRCHLAHIRPDVLMDGLLKDSPSSQIFTVTGLPRVTVHAQSGAEYVVEMEGVDIYDPVSNTIRATRAEKVAAWFLDSDYDGKTFYVTQAFFPDKSAWDKLAKALKGVVEPELFDAFSSTRSLPFKAGPHGRVAVKVIDPRGNEVMRVQQLGEVRYEQR